MDSTQTKRPRVLVIDDGHMNRRLAERMLQRLGCEVFSADGLDSAAAILRTQPLDLVLSDIEMPGAEDLKLPAHIRELAAAASPSGPRLRVVAVSGDGLGSDPAAYRAEGFDGYIPKPINLNTLREQLSLCHQPVN